jgi:hypothetical protein
MGGLTLKILPVLISWRKGAAYLGGRRRSASHQLEYFARLKLRFRADNIFALDNASGANDEAGAVVL